MKYKNTAEGFMDYFMGELSYDDFDKSGRIGIWKLSRLVEGARRTRFSHGSDFTWEELGAASVFIRSHSFTVHPSFYAAPLQSTSLKIRTFTSHVGRTSFCVDANVYNLATNELLATISTHCVLVSVETRRPTPIPAKVVPLIRVIPTHETRPVSGPEFPKRPSSSFTQTRAVMPSDTDLNEHLNQAAFIRFCFDCASMAAMQGKLASFASDLIYSDAEAVWVLYINEAELGAELTLHCWEDRKRNCTLWVEVRLGSGVIGQCQMKFYEDVPQSASARIKEALTIAKL